MMSELDSKCKEIVIDLKKIDIFAKYVLAKTEFKDTEILFGKLTMRITSVQEKNFR